MPTATPYWSGIPIDVVVPLLKDKESPVLKQCKDAYQSLIGSIEWLAHFTCPDLSTVIRSWIMSLTTLIICQIILECSI
jgi:hypothetical protein